MRRRSNDAKLDRRGPAEPLLDAGVGILRGAERVVLGARRDCGRRATLRTARQTPEPDRCGPCRGPGGAGRLAGALALSADSPGARLGPVPFRAGACAAIRRRARMGRGTVERDPGRSSRCLARLRARDRPLPRSALAGRRNGVARRAARRRRGVGRRGYRRHVLGFGAAAPRRHLGAGVRSGHSRAGRGGGRAGGDLGVGRPWFGRARGSGAGRARRTPAVVACGMPKMAWFAGSARARRAGMGAGPAGASDRMVPASGDARAGRSEADRDEPVPQSVGAGGGLLGRRGGGLVVRRPPARRGGEGRRRGGAAVLASARFGFGPFWNHIRRFSSAAARTGWGAPGRPDRVCRTPLRLGADRPAL